MGVVYLSELGIGQSVSGSAPVTIAICA
jgi:hypothetical protein